MAAEIEQFVNFGVAEDTSRANESSTDRTYSPLLHAQPVEQGSEDVDLSEYIQLDDSIRPRLGQTLVFQAEGRQGFDPGSFEPKAIFLTGATGFLGAFILNDLLRTFSKCTVYCLVRAKTEEDGWKRLERNMEIHLLWKAPARPDDIENMRSRTRVVLGDLAKPWLGIGSSAGNETAPAKFLELADTVDCVVHNGALVHWVYPLSKLKPANVDGTVEALKLCVLGKYLKPFHFVSSTSVLDTAHYTQQKLTSVLESDDLEGSRRGLKSGYGQSKWVAEKILSLASTRAAHGNDGPCIPITVIRPGYILGDSRTGVTNTDDFIWRLCKGCLELGQVPIMTNVVNVSSVEVSLMRLPKIAANDHSSPRLFL
jgi:L-aminoadipate-semialdehyde dehydrogenase